MNPVAAANIISGEKCVVTINFVLTGDKETDSICGVLAVFDNLFGAHFPENKMRVCLYLAERYRAEREREVKEASQWQEIKGALGGAPSAPPTPIPYPQWVQGASL